MICGKDEPKRHHHKTEPVSECQASECPPVSSHMGNIGACWLTSAKGNWLSSPWKGLTGVYLNITSLSPRTFPCPLLQMHWPPCCSAHILSLCTCSFPRLFRLFLQIITWLFTPSPLASLCSEVLHHHPIYNCIPIYSTPSTWFFSKVLTPI